MSSSETNEQDENTSKKYRPEVLTDDLSGTSMLPTIIFAVLILCLMTWGLFALYNYMQNSESQKVENNIANNNVKVDENAENENTNKKANQTSQTDSIKVKITTSAPELAILSKIDGKTETRLLNPEVKEQIYEAEESLVLSYYKGSAETVQIDVNGKKVETPLPPKGYRKNGFQFEINMKNVKQILDTGKIPIGEPANKDAKTDTPAEPAP